MNTTDTPADFGPGEKGEVRRWLKELELASKVEKEWRDTALQIYDRYRGKKRRRNSFNILWSNTETLAPALYNSPPKPDVRRRFKDADPVGKVVAQMLERCLEFQTDTGPFAESVKADVLDMLLPGRGVSRVRYVPSFAPGQAEAAEPAAEEATESAATEAAEGDEATERAPDVLAYEQCEVEHVQWDHFRRGPGKTWREVPWIAFKHDMTKDMVVDLAGAAMAEKLKYSPAEDDTMKKEDPLQTVFGTVEVWEFWCKDERKVKFIAPCYKDAPIKSVDDPLRLNDFWPCPRPLYAISDSSSLVPLPIFEQYREQAEELNRISMRINKIIDALKVRGLYDATLAELSDLMRNDDNQLTPVQNAAMWADKGGLEKAIWMMPVEPAAKVLKVLYEQRDATKQVIYEITGIADVMRGQTDANETLGAQKLKAKFGSQRITGLQLEVQRYARDLIHIMSEIVAEKFQPETLLRMSQMQIPTNEQIEQKKNEMLQQMAQQQQQQQPPAQPGQPPAPPPDMNALMQQLPPRPVSLEQVLEVLHDDATRMFKIDVETDSMVAATVEEDMQGLQQVLTGVVQFIEGVAPAVQAGAFPVEAVKEIVMTICRRSKMGSAVEDALEKIQAPKQQGDPEQAKAQAAMQAAQVKAQSDQQIAQAQVQAQTQIETVKAQAKVQIEAAAQQAQQQTDVVRQQAEAEQHRMKLENEAQIEALKAQYQDAQAARDLDFQRWKFQTEQDNFRWKAELDAATKIQVATVMSKAKVDDAATEASTKEIASEVTQ